MAKSKKDAPLKIAQRGAANANSNQPDMKTSEIRDLIDFISQSGLNEVNIETSELKLHVKRAPDKKIFKSAPVQVAAALPAAASVPAAATATTPSKTERPAAPTGDKTVAGMLNKSRNPNS